MPVVTPEWSAAAYAPEHRTDKHTHTHAHTELTNSNVNSPEVRAVARDSGTPGRDTETFECE